MARKSKRAVQRERNAVLEVLREAPASGLRQRSIRERYAARYGNHIAYMTLQARLRELEAEGLLTRSRPGRNPHYILADVQRQGMRGDQGANAEASQPEEPIPLSAHARQARALVRRPRMERTPVAYDPAFLDAYEPGPTWYLPQPLRDHLRELGGTTYAGQPAGTYARDIMQRLIIDLSWGSSRLEGLRYSRIDTEELLEEDRSPPGATPLDRQLILNHKAAIEFLVEEAESIAFNRFTILNLHALLAENLLGDPEDEGRLRTRPIGIGDSVYTPTTIPQLIEGRFDAIMGKAAAITDPMEQSFFIMVHLPYLQPFIDVNKRTSRLAANIPLIKGNLCPLSFVDVPEREYTEGTLAVYELRDVALLRDVFAWAYERSCAQFKVLRQSMGEPDPIRLKYRSQLRTVVAEVVRSLRWPSPERLEQFARELEVPAADHRRFVEEATRNLKSLRPEKLARYALRKSEFDAWTAAVSTERGS
jgi:hypothetical protein